MNDVPHDLLVLFAVMFGLSTYILSWSIKRLRKNLYDLDTDVKKMNRRLKREETLTDMLSETLREHDVHFEEVDAILEEMRTLHNSS